MYSDSNIFLVDLKERYELSPDIIFGDALRMSITTNDSYYFATNIQIVHKSKVISIKEASENEHSFFELLRNKKEIPFSKKLATEYNLIDYIETRNK